MQEIEFNRSNAELYRRLNMPYNIDACSREYYYGDYVTQSTSSNFDIKDYLKYEI